MAGSWATKMLHPASFGVEKISPGAIPGVNSGALGSSWHGYYIFGDIEAQFYHKQYVLIQVAGQILVFVHRGRKIDAFVHVLKALKLKRNQIRTNKKVLPRCEGFCLLARVSCNEFCVFCRPFDGFICFFFLSFPCKNKRQKTNTQPFHNIHSHKNIRIHHLHLMQLHRFA